MRLTLSETQFELLGELYDRNSMASLTKSVRNKELAEFQTLAVAHAILVKSCLINVDTGLGKTLIATAIMNVLHVLQPTLRWIFVCQANNVETTYRKLCDGVFNLSIVYSNATEDKLISTFLSRSAVNADVIVISYEGIMCPVAEEFFFRNRNIFKGIFIDESHMLSNLTSPTSRLISAITNSCIYKYALTATPLRVVVDQMVNQVYMIDRHMFDGEDLAAFVNRFKVYQEGRVVGYKDLDELKYLLLPRMFSKSRTDLGLRGNYRPIVELCPTRPEYAEIPKNQLTQFVKTDENGEALNRLLSIVEKYKQAGKHGLVYANYNVIKEAAADKLRSAGLRVGIMDGKHTPTDRKKALVHQSYLDGELDVLVTNITTGKDLPSDYIIFYQQTFDYKQMVGRGERGLAGVDLDLVFVLVKETHEIPFFYNNVYRRGMLLEELCDKDLSELKEVVKLLEYELSSNGELYANLEMM